MPGERARENGLRALHWWRDQSRRRRPRSATRHARSDNTALKTAVDNCLAVVATGAACCSGRGLRRGDSRSDWDVSLVTDMNGLFSEKAQFNATSRGGTSARSRTCTEFRNAYAFNAEYRGRQSVTCTGCSCCQPVQRGHIAVGRQLGHEHVR